ncbi:hypothetical protein PHMEG_0002904 [Phytophthora megakarya]|uniref:Uncharacterized protein n=1 Tax=Phytophthora megakarya TaxID=4795 RepID=A0A225WXW4_9STRA|nr:hypothetical protein PHMEG_0002904 [Phytophthora megakarya]
MDVDQVLAALDVEALRATLLATSAATSTTDEVQTVQRLADALALAADHELEPQMRDVLRVVKSLSRLVTTCVAATAAGGAVLAALDDKLLPMLRVLRTVVMRSSDREEDEKQLRKWLPFVLTACSFVNGAELPGADLMKSVVLADEVLDEAVALAKAGDRPSLMAKYVAQVVALCSQDVAKSEWVAIASVHKRILWHVVQQVSFPHLGGDLLGRLLALTFPLVDELTDATQLIGARLLRHIIANVTPTELRWYSDILLEVLHTAIVTRKADTLGVLLDCLVESLDKLSPPGEVKHYDRFTPRLLSDTSLCSDVAVRVVFVRHVRALVVLQGAPHSLNVIRYLQPLLKVLLAGFESVNVAFLVTTLETLQATVLAAWPRIAPHTERILVGVLRAVAFCELFDEGAEFTPSPKGKEQILGLCEDVLDQLYQVNAGNSIVSDMLKVVSSQTPKLAPNEKINGNGAPKRKDKYEERWKRPYEIVATVLDKKAEESSSSTLDLAQVLDSYPTAPATPDSFEPKDVIAFKTLSLCLETWQPVVSEWKCGQVQSVDAPGASIKLSTWTLEANGNSVDFCETPNGEQLDVQTNEISEVRILSGPSYRPLGQTAPYPNPDEQEN